MAPIVDGLEAQYGEQVVFKRINANHGDGPDIMQTYRIPGHPTTLIFSSSGQEVERFIGPQAEEPVKQVLLDVISDSR